MSKKFDILVIDDEQIILDAVRMIALSEDYQVDSVLDANKGLELLDKNNYKLVISDIMMPDMNGFDFLVEVKKRGIRVPILMVTGYSTTENFVKSLNLQAFELLPKPFTSDELLFAISRGIKFHNFLQTSDTNDYFKMMNLPKGYKSMGINSWISPPDKDGVYKIGITDIYSKIIGTATVLETFPINEYIVQGEICCHIENTSHIDTGILAPISGRIIEINDKVKSSLGLFEKSPFEDAWIYRIIPTNLDPEIEHLHKA
jgi:CheY-like chemotaxis protein